MNVCKQIVPMMDLLRHLLPAGRFLRGSVHFITVFTRVQFYFSADLTVNNFNRQSHHNKEKVTFQQNHRRKQCDVDSEECEILMIVIHTRA